MILILFSVLVMFILERGAYLAVLMVDKRLELRASENLDLAAEEIREKLNNEVIIKSREVFEEILEGDVSGERLSEEEAEELYVRKIEEYIKERFQNPVKSVTDVVNDINKREATKPVIAPKVLIRESGHRTVRLEEPDKMSLSDMTDAGRYAGSLIGNVRLIYYGDFEQLKEKEYDIEIRVPKARFYSGNDLLFEFSMLAQKGIYFTGRTSSVVGSIFAGTHEASEFRQAEARYGEKGVYGGIDFLSTHLGAEADYVVTTGDINVKGSFVMFGVPGKEVELYASALNKLDGFGSEKDVTIIGNTHIPPDNEEYNELLSAVDEGLSKLPLLADYYDSANDRSYKGTYRKILSNYDVIISGDFTGAIVTSGNVILEADSNVEGIIISGDRIYVQGNNNIVSNSAVLRTIVDEEIIEEKKNGVTEDPEGFLISHYLKDYIGDIRLKGIE